MKVKQLIMNGTTFDRISNENVWSNECTKPLAMKKFVEHRCTKPLAMKTPIP